MRGLDADYAAFGVALSFASTHGIYEPTQNGDDHFRLAQALQKHDSIALRRAGTTLGALRRERRWADYDPAPQKKGWGLPTVLARAAEVLKALADAAAVKPAKS